MNPDTTPPTTVTAKAITRLNESLETPLLKLVGKGVWIVVLGLIAIGIYAGRAKLHEEIAANPTLATAVGQLKATDVQLATVIDKVVTQQQQMTTQLAVVGEQIKQGAVSTDRLERTVNRLAERLPATR